MDLAAPGELVAPYLQFAASGTSFAAPHVAGAAAFALAAFPDLYRGQPRRLAERLRQTVRTKAASGTASFLGKTAALGRVDLPIALSPSNVPPGAPWRDFTGSLREAHALPTTGVALFTQTVQLPGGMGPVTVLVRVYGGSGATGAETIPITFQKRRPGDWFRGHPEGIDFVGGTHGDIEHADFDLDGCEDLVIAGLFVTDLSPPPGALGIRGWRPHILIQERTTLPGGAPVCMATFRYAPSAFASALTGPWEASRDVEVRDFNADGRPDIVFASMRHPQVALGANHDIRLFLNDPALGFVDVSAAVPGTVDIDAKTIAACDLNGDGSPDLVQGGQSLAPGGAPVQVMLQLPDGTFEELSPSLAGLPDFTRVDDIACFDVDSDGNMDLLVALPESTRNGLFLGDGGGGFSDASASLPDHASPPPDLAYLVGPPRTASVSVCHTADAPGVPTVFFGNGGDHRLGVPNVVLRPGVDEQFHSALEETGFGFDAAADSTHVIRCADLDGDGATDAVVVGNNGRDYLYGLAQPAIGGGP